MPTLYWKSTCKTSRKVRTSLCDVHADLGCRNYASIPLTVDEVRRLVVAAGGVPAVLNTAHAFAKAERWECDPPTVEIFVAAAAADANLLRRPILLAGRQAVVGDQVQAMLALIAG
jgi:arsenate reductase-like glutaredoxin family protein